MEAVATEANISAHPLVGKFFHSYKKNQIEWQGIVESEASPGQLLVQLFSWLTGYDTDQHIVPVEKMTKWKFYNTADDMQDAYRRSSEIRTKGESHSDR
jgi:hypothetical protein